MGIVFNKARDDGRTDSRPMPRYCEPSSAEPPRGSADEAAPSCHRPALGAPRFPQRPADPCDPARARGQHRTRHDLPAPRTHGELRRRGRPDSRGGALWLNESGPFATPAHWRPIDRAIVNLDIPTDAGKELFPDLDVVKPYLRYTGPLQSEPDSQTGPEPSAPGRSPGRSRAWSQMRPTYLLPMNRAAVTGR